MIPFTIADHSITFFAKGEPHHVGRDNPHFDEIRQSLLTATADVDQLIDWTDTGRALTTASQGRFTVTFDSVLYRGEPIDNYFTQKLLQLQAQKLPFDALLNVLESLYRNPSRTARERFPLFAKINDLQWLPDGRMTALKVVRDDFRDVYSGTFDNKPGQTVQIERGDVDDDANRTCSHGLHLGAYAYIPHFGLWDKDRRAVLCAYWPEDVVAVPVDYNGSKMRVCRYDVLEEISKDYIEEFVRSHQNRVDAYDLDVDMSEDDEESEDNYY